MKTCNICKTEKELACFNRNKNRKDGYEFRCKECRKKDFKKDYYGSIRIRASRMRNLCIKRKSRAEVEITTEWIMERIEEGCALTGRKFDLDNSHSPFAPSVDRIDSSKGYAIDNCRVIIAIANYAKNQWDDETLYELARLLLR